MAERIDEVEKFYIEVQRIELISVIIFWLSSGMSIFVLYAPKIFAPKEVELSIVLFAVIVFLHYVFSKYSVLYLLPRANAIRRKQLLSDSFDVALVLEKTSYYYNNSIVPSISKLGLNVLENTFFAKQIAATMAVRERIKVLIYSAIWLTSIFYRGSDLGLLIILTQIVFSSEIITRLLKIELLRMENENLYSELYNLYLNRSDTENKNFIATVLNIFASYESNKSLYSIALSKNVFLSINEPLSHKWENVKNDLNLN